jgi:hypothetical protein
MPFKHPPRNLLFAIMMRFSRAQLIGASALLACLWAVLLYRLFFSAS